MISITLVWSRLSWISWPVSCLTLSLLHAPPRPFAYIHFLNQGGFAGRVHLSCKCHLQGVVVTGIPWGGGCHFPRVQVRSGEDVGAVSVTPEPKGGTQGRLLHFNKGLCQSLHGLLVPKAQTCSPIQIQQLEHTGLSPLLPPWRLLLFLHTGQAPSRGLGHGASGAAGGQAGVEIGSSPLPTGTSPCQPSRGRVGQGGGCSRSISLSGQCLLDMVDCFLWHGLDLKINFWPPVAMKWDLRLQLFSSSGVRPRQQSSWHVDGMEALRSLEKSDLLSCGMALSCLWSLVAIYVVTIGAYLTGYLILYLKNYL